MENGMISGIQLLEQFFALENERRWDDYAIYLAENVEWILYENGKQIAISGKNEYLKRIKQAYIGVETRFEARNITEYKKQNRIITLLENSNGDMSIDIFEIKDGKIIKEWEYIP